ncbi:Extradiol ring-cleavage dioxygenase class III enzyme subunit B [Stereum hirsutum FP-91666 SS1]|uniref:Extradiol ring-cleavage dioxygenase class III enzyme subunit B n=1 Tax=Stereum hirsutum (strain FP-91666) TaxID=721885 RepID=UPI000441002D|nr:Extradiol ring-cleavage dioxygenase class III enzyme subunit B [Stereum hirsutum FP-91666 SS1]EIM90214.1 Extradiol ring-cleavage dioxygenase class III enzyme subunit B [Stereum hirsutum FP-91666 SS1]
MPGLTVPALPKNRDEWLTALDALPSNASSSRIPSFFFAHGSPMLAFPDDEPTRFGDNTQEPALHMGPRGPLAAFLKDFGPALLKKYNPKAIVVFSAHWETRGETLVTDYGDRNPLFYDYYGFPKSLYELAFNSRGDKALANHIVDLLKHAGLLARLTTTLEPRGQDGLGRSAAGFDHGIFVPFRLMFGEELRDIPIVQISIDGSLSPEKNWQLGKAVAQLREEGVLVLSGGLTMHNLRDFSSFAPSTAGPGHKSFSDAVTSAISISDPKARKEALVALPKHQAFRAAHPREEHFVPIYVAAGAGEEGDVRVLSAVYGQHTVAFGL